MKGGALVVQHDVVGSRDTHDEVASSDGEKGKECVHVVLISLGMVCVADIDAHGKAEEFAAKVVFETCAYDLFTVVKIFRADKADDAVDEERGEFSGNGVGAGFEGLLVDTMVGVCR